jgi:hypothetical protein
MLVSADVERDANHDPQRFVMAICNTCFWYSLFVSCSFQCLVMMQGMIVFVRSGTLL